MPIDPTFAFRSLFANPSLAKMIDGAANRLNTRSGGGATATATATAGGATATATATAGSASAPEGSVLYFAERALGMGSNAGGLGGAPGGAVGSFTTGLVEGLSSTYAPASPNPLDAFPPSSGVQPSMLSVDSSGKITTAGGYTIEATKRHEWIITGPDGSKTRVWGDPHVETIGKGGIQEKFDFKKDTTFVLPDGTKINVKCTPWEGNQNFTVTQSLEIIQGNDRVQVDGIDKGKGTVGKVVHGGEGAKETFRTEQTFVAGRNVADWYFNGAEIKENLDGPDTFKVGPDVLSDVLNDFISDWKNGTSPISEAAWRVGGLNSQANGTGMNTAPSSAELTDILRKHGQLAQQGQVGNVMEQVLALLPKLISVLQSLVQLRSHNPYNPQPLPKPTEQPRPQQPPPVYDPNAHTRGLRDAFNAIGTMFVSLGQLLQLASGLRPAALPVQGF